jgi:hypothetical protein
LRTSVRSAALLPCVRPRAAVLLPREALEFALQLAPALEPFHVERPIGERRTHGAAGLAAVRTVGEAALPCERFEILEGGLDSRVRVPQLQLAHPGRVEHQPALG